MNRRQQVMSNALSPSGLRTTTKRRKEKELLKCGNVSPLMNDPLSQQLV